MSYSNLNEKIVSELEHDFPNHSFDLRTINYGGVMPILFINSEDEKWLKKDWEPITSFIAVNYQAQLDQEYETWNIYLFFLIKSQIEKSLKYQIENDTFSSRKIVIESEMDADKIIEEYIFNNDIKIGGIETLKAEQQFCKDERIANILQDKKVRNKRTNTTIAQGVLNGLYKNIERENNEV